MTDAALLMHVTGGDLELTSSEQLLLDEGLQTAVSISLYSDRRASAEELERTGFDRPRGWWADSESDRWGSRLWLLSRDVVRDQTLARARGYAREALLWLISDGIASDVQVEAARAGTHGICLTVRIWRGTAARWAHLWQGLTFIELEFDGAALPAPAPREWNFGSALAPRGSQLDYGTALQPTGPPADFGSA